MYIHTCIYIYIYVYMYKQYIRIYMYTQRYMDNNICMYTCLLLWQRRQTPRLRAGCIQNVERSLYIRKYVYIHIHICICIYIYIYIYNIYICIYTYKYAYVYVHTLRRSGQCMKKEPNIRKKRQLK